MNEAETRAEHIDPALKAAGWGVVDGSRTWVFALWPRPRRKARCSGAWRGGRLFACAYVIAVRFLICRMPKTVRGQFIARLFRISLAPLGSSFNW